MSDLYPPIDYTEFSQALARTPAAGIELSDDTRARYMRGLVPNQFDWLVRHPVLLRALLRVAEHLQPAESVNA
jgi:hypothetical protein